MTLDEADSSAEVAQKTRENIPVSEETKDAFFSEVLSLVPDRLQAHLKNASDVAISGPNRLELSFPQSYVLSRQFCERPETLERVAECATQIAGESIEISIALTTETESPSPGQPPTPKRRTTGQQKKPDISGDLYVQQALDIFGGSVIDTREISQPATEGQ